MKKKILSTLLALCLTLSLAPMALADSTPPMAKIGDQTYATAQAALDAAKSGDVIELAAGNHGALVLGGATPVAGAGCSYECRSCTTENGTPVTFTSAEEFKAHLEGKAIKNGVEQNSTWHGTPYYTRTIDNLTIKGVEGTVVDGIAISVGHVYASGSSTVKDPVLNIDKQGSVYYMSAKLSSITIQGITLTKSVKVCADQADMLWLNGLTVSNCSIKGTDKSTNSEDNKLFSIRGGIDGEHAIKNILIDSCQADTVFQGVYIQGTVDATVQNCKFNNIQHNAVAFQNLSFSGESYNSGVRVVKENTMTNGSDRAIRVGSLTGGNLAINNNTIANYQDDSGEVYKASSVAADATIAFADNTYNDCELVFTSHENGMPTVVKSAVATVDGTAYAALGDAITAAEDGDKIVLLCDVTAADGISVDKAGMAFTLDLAGHTYTITDGANVNNRGFKIVSGTMKVIDSKGTGKMVALSNDDHTNGAYGVFRVEADGALELEDITLENHRKFGLNVKVVGGRATLTDVIINSEFGGGIEVTEADLGAHSKAGNATVTNCTFTQSGHYDHCSTALAVSGGSTLNVKGGTYSGEYGLYVYSSGGQINVESGTFSGVKNVVKAEIDTGSYPDYEGCVKLQDGNYTGEMAVTSPASMEISGGYFTADPSAYLAEGKVLVDNDNAAYLYKVGDKNTEITVDTAVSAGEPKVTMPEGATSGITQLDIETAAKAPETTGSLHGAASGLTNDPQVVGTEDAAKEKLDEAKVTVAEDDVITVVVQPYLDIQVIAVDSANKSMELDISAKYNVIATTDPNDIQTDGASKNAAYLAAGETLPAANKPITITLPLPTSLDESNLFVKHIAESGTYYYAAAYADGMVSFVNPHGFSTFYLMNDTRTVTVTFNGTEETLTPDKVGEALPAATSAGQVFDGWTFGGVAGGPYKTLTDELLTALSELEEPIAAAAVFHTPSSGSGTYAVSVGSTENGAVTVSSARASKGDTVTISVKADSGYTLDTLTVTDKNGDELKLTDKGDGKYSFTMPASGVTVTAVFTLGDHDCPFEDVSSSHWFHDAVHYVQEAGLMNGVGEDLFAPDAKLTRGMMMTILARLDGADTTGSQPWYQAGLNWAVTHGVSDGSRPEAEITREQLATMLWRYAGSPESKASLDAFTDADAVSDWAATALAWATAQEIVTGRPGGILDPAGTATRAEAAQMLMRFSAR